MTCDTYCLQKKRENKSPKNEKRTLQLLRVIVMDYSTDVYARAHSVGVVTVLSNPSGSRLEQQHTKETEDSALHKRNLFHV